MYGSIIQFVHYIVHSKLNLSHKIEVEVQDDVEKDYIFYQECHVIQCLHTVPTRCYLGAPVHMINVGSQQHSGFFTFTLQRKTWHRVTHREIFDPPFHQSRAGAFRIV